MRRVADMKRLAAKLQRKPFCKPEVAEHARIQVDHTGPGEHALVQQPLERRGAGGGDEPAGERARRHGGPRRQRGHGEFFVEVRQRISKNAIALQLGNELMMRDGGIVSPFCNHGQILQIL